VVFVLDTEKSFLTVR